MLVDGPRKIDCLLELGHAIGLTALPSKGKSTVDVKLVLSNADLVKHYQQVFADKQSHANPRVNLEWLSMATFKKRLHDSPA